MKTHHFESRHENPLRRTRVPLTPGIEGTTGVARGLWYESSEEIADAIAEGRRKEELLQWVYAQMKRSLTSSERRCVTLYYLGPLSLREVGQRLGMAPTTARRHVRDGIVKLREAARKSRSSVVRNALRRK